MCVPVCVSACVCVVSIYGYARGADEVALLIQLFNNNKCYYELPVCACVCVCVCWVDGGVCVCVCCIME